MTPSRSSCQVPLLFHDAAQKSPTSSCPSSWPPLHSELRDSLLALTSLASQPLYILCLPNWLNFSNKAFCVSLCKLHNHPLQGFPGGSDGKESACNEGDLGWEDSPGEGNRNPLQNSCLENSMDRGIWWATVHGVANS